MGDGVERGEGMGSAESAAEETLDEEGAAVWSDLGTGAYVWVLEDDAAGGRGPMSREGGGGGAGSWTSSSSKSLPQSSPS